MGGASVGRPDLRVVRLDLWIDPAFDTAIAQDSRLDLRVLPAQGDAVTAAGLAGAHAYHVSAAKDEVPARWQVSANLLALCPELLCVSSGGAGYDTVDVAACTRAGVAVVNQAGANAASVAEMTFALLLSLVKRLGESEAALRAGTAVSREALMGREIEGRVIGLVGIGEIGRRVARIAAGFGLKVIAYDPLLTDAQITDRGAAPVTFAALLEQADIVSLHCPLNAGTRGMFGTAALRRMKPGALFISTARGGIHDEDALLAALESGHLAGAGLDVWQVEPPPPHSGLLQRSDVAVAFHTGGVTHEGRRKVAQGSATQIIDMLAGRRPDRLLNPEVWPRFLARLAEHGIKVPRPPLL
ncbi:hydroxyacid dehydrogenase [Bordetella genomosp. 5]|uniref:3-phosphoglycerate dehydrogenase n=1 Tax=Bordetella genomosp. 5 TaxID=1395608 RepID=A0A261TZU7_9BORD|nr:hydroxyacid dehydrogenase [Bordetella genomosp. 5]OZI55214.1 3-phosphoglycerate dehydrogenase [Bordetella genomosp. 5]